MVRHSKPFVSGSALKLSLVVMAVAAATQAGAAENGLQRYSPGIGGSDMTSPLTPGWYVQFPLVVYHANKIKGNDGKQATTSMAPVAARYSVPALAGARAATDVKADTYALLPRVTYLDGAKFLGANIGWSAMLPIVKRKAEFGFTLPSPYTPYQPYADGAAATQYGSVNGIGDVEVSALMHWEIGDHQAVTFAPTIVLPTGDYDVSKRVNAGYGNFVTFRPSVQYAFIGDGWDVGGRAVLSFNTRNADNGYFSGHMFNLDWQAMKFVTEDVRLGLQGYFVRQLTKDTQDLTGYSSALAKEIIEGNKASVNAAGPAVAWLRNGGEFLLEGKFLKEFDARNRMEGKAFWLTLSKPL